MFCLVYGWKDVLPKSGILIFFFRFYYVATHKIRFTCALSFDSFPFDNHDCFFELYFDNPDSELRFRFFHSNISQWGLAETTTILSYQTKFLPLPEERLVRSHTFFSGLLQVNQSVAGFRLQLHRKVGAELLLAASGGSEY